MDIVRWLPSSEKDSFTEGSNRLSTGLLLISLVLLVIVVVRNAWVTDDAYITFRTVDNFVNGYGLTWNTAERVQAYTHPLWMFLMSTVYFFTHEAYYTSIVLSTTITMAAVIVFSFKISRTRLLSSLMVITLLTSKAFIDYATSGLENPLTHLLLALFFWIYLNKDHHEKTLLYLSLLVSLAMVNRLDTVLLFLPSLALSFFNNRSRKTVLYTLAGFLPFFAWELFSLFYYGFLFPNTAYAKLNTGISSGAMAQQGMYYLWNSLRMDPLTLSVIAFAVVAVLLKKAWPKLPLVIGSLLYVLYVIKVGGDFMSGRFLTAPLFLSVITLATIQFDETKLRKAWLPLLAFILLVGFRSPHPPLFNTADYGKTEYLIDIYGIADERGYYYQAAGLLNAKPGVEMPNHPWSFEGRQAAAEKLPVVVRPAIGYYGYFSGPRVFIVDSMALAEPFLARLPAKKSWRIGHFERNIPPGYLKTLKTGQNSIRNKGLADYYEKLQLIIRGNLWDPERLRTIWNMNTGQYDNLLKR